MFMVGCDVVWLSVCGCIVNSVGICFSFSFAFTCVLLIAVLGCLCCGVCVVLVVVYSVCRCMVSCYG